MGSLSDDIIKYKKGELSAKEMHALEKKALADPFLAEALVGVENISPEEFAADISMLEKQILNKRKTILFTPLRIAAGIILVAGSIFFIYQFIPKTETIALKTDKPQLENKSEGEKPGSGSSQGIEEEKVESQKLKIESQKEQNKKPEPIVSSNQNLAAKTHQADQDKLSSGVAAQQPNQQIQAEDIVAAEAQPAKIENVDDRKLKEIAAPQTKAAGASAISRDNKKEAFVPSEAQRSAIKSAKKIQVVRSISGQVSAAEDGSPLPGVNVVVKGSTNATVTDLKGNYSISPEAENSSLVFSFIGLQQQEIDASGKSKVDVQMKDDVTQLSEVVVTGAELKDDQDNEPMIQLAEPMGGKKAYDHYLESNLRYPDEALKNMVKGKASIEFKVTPDGSLKDFHVIKKLGYGCEEEIIRLVKEGPKWTPSTRDNKPIESTVKVRLRFSPPKTGR